MTNGTILKRTNLLQKAVPYLHTHLGTPPGFGRTILLSQMYSKFTRGGRSTRAECLIDAAQEPLRDIWRTLRPPPGESRWIIAVDNVSGDDFEALALLLAEMESRGRKTRLFTAGTPLPHAFILHKAAGTTLELNMEDLAFSPAEALLLSPLHGERLRELTGGWPLPMAHLATLPPFAAESALDDDASPLRIWVREQIWSPLKEELRELFLRSSTLNDLSEETLSTLGFPKELFVDLQEAVWKGFPILHGNQGLSLHPFMRRCLLAKFGKTSRANEYWSDTVLFHQARGDLISAADAAFESKDAPTLAVLLAKLESTLLRISDETLKKKLGLWLDYVSKKGLAVSSRILSLAARYEHMLGRDAPAQEWAIKAISAARIEDDAGAIIRTSLMNARILRCRASIEESDRLLLNLAEEFPEATWALRYEIVAETAFNRILECDYRTALAQMQTLQEKAKEDGHRVALWAERFMTIPLFYMGRHTEALACFEKSKSLPLERSFLLDRHGVHIVAAKCLQIQGRMEEARVLIEEQLAMKKFSDDPDDLGISLLLAVEAELTEQEPQFEERRGDLSKMRGYLEQARTLLSTSLTNPFFHVWYDIYDFIANGFADPQAIRKNMPRLLGKTRSTSPLLHVMALLRGSIYRRLFFNDFSELPEIIGMLQESLEICRRIECGLFLASIHATLAGIYESLWLRHTAKKHLQSAFAHFAKENQAGLFHPVREMAPLVQMALEYDIAPEFVSRLVVRYGYRPQRWRVELFGEFRVIPLSGNPEGKPAPLARAKVREMFAYLIHNGRHSIAREKLIEDLWPNMTRERAKRLCGVTLSHLRGILKDLGLSRALTMRNENFFFDTSDILTDAEGLEWTKKIRALLPQLEQKGQNLSEEFELLRLAPLRRGYLAEFNAPWAREAAQKVTASITDFEKA